MDNKNNNSKKTGNNESKIDVRALELVKEQAAKTTSKAERAKLLEKFKAILAGDEDVAKEIHKLYDPDYIDEDEDDDFDFDDFDIPDFIQNSASDNDDNVDEDDEDDDNIEDNAQNDEQKPKKSTSSMSLDNADGFSISNELGKIDYSLDGTGDVSQVVIEKPDFSDVASDSEGGVADVVNDYLESAFVAKQMKQYEKDLWDSCEADYLDMHKNTYQHVFEPDKKDVSLNTTKKYKDNLQRYRKSEDAAVAAYSDSFNNICENKQNHDEKLGGVFDRNARSHFKGGFALAVIAAIIGLVAGIALLVFTNRFDGHAQYKGMSDESDWFYIAKSISIALIVFSPVSLIANIFFFRREDGSRRIVRIKAKDPVTGQSVTRKHFVQRYAGSLARGIIVFILIIGMIVGSLWFFLPAYKSVEIESKDYGYTFDIVQNSDRGEVAYITGVYDEKMLPEVVDYYYEANIPTEVSRYGKTYKVVGIKLLNNSNITRLVIGEHIESIETGSIVSSNLKEIVIKDNRKEKGPIYEWFGSGSDEYSIPSELTKIDYTIVGNDSDCYVSGNMFDKLSNVTDIKISDATSIGSNAFSECTNLRNLDLGDCNKNFTMNMGSLSNCQYLEKLSLPSVEFGKSAYGDSVRNVVEYLCYNYYLGYNYMRYLTEITVTKDTSIPDYAFCQVYYVQTIRLENAVTVGKYCFAGCDSLTSIYVQPSLKKYIENNRGTLLYSSANANVYEI